MLTPKLEELILSGKAFFKTHTHSLGMFGQIILPKDSYAVITKIIWYPFIDPPEVGAGGRVAINLMQWMEYQMAINSDKSKNYYQFRNSVDVTLLKAPAGTDIEHNSLWADVAKYMVLQPKPPIIIDTYLVHETSINIVISRNIGQNHDDNNFTYGLLNNTANQPIDPAGVGRVPVALDDEVLDNFSQPILSYQPPNAQNTNVATTPQYSQEYKQGIAYDHAQVQSELTNFQSLPFFSLSRAIQTPMVTFHYVVVQKNTGEKIVGG